MRRTLAKFGLPFEKATPLVHCPEAFKRTLNNAGPAGKLHISTQPIESFPLTYGMWSYDKEKLSILLEPHLEAQSSDFFLSFQDKN